MASAFDLATLVQSLVQADIPPLPEAAFRQVCVHMLWGFLLATAAWRAGTRLQPRWRQGLAALVVVWAAIQGPVSPAYWLEMAFAAPSWTSALLCGMWLLQQTRTQAVVANSWRAGEPTGIPWLWALFGIALGWALALDTFAALPFAESVYAWGFSPLATLCLALFGAGAWVVRPRWASALPLLAVALYVSTRLPSGNIWDAVIDPLLWLYLHGAVAVRVWKQLRGGARR